jgi:hypothetical protein
MQTMGRAKSWWQKSLAGLNIVGPSIALGRILTKSKIQLKVGFLN